MVQPASNPRLCELEKEDVKKHKNKKSGKRRRQIDKEGPGEKKRSD